MEKVWAFLPQIAALVLIYLGSRLALKKLISRDGDKIHDPEWWKNEPRIASTHICFGLLLSSTFTSLAYQAPLILAPQSTRYLLLWVVLVSLASAFRLVEKMMMLTGLQERPPKEEVRKVWIKVGSFCLTFITTYAVSHYSVTKQSLWVAFGANLVLIPAVPVLLLIVGGVCWALYMGGLLLVGGFFWLIHMGFDLLEKLDLLTYKWRKKNNNRPGRTLFR